MSVGIDCGLESRPVLSQKSAMATENVTHAVLVVATDEVGQAAEQALNAAGALRAKAVPGARQALAAIGSLGPHFLVIQAGHVPVPGMQAVKNMAELAASRPVPVLMVCGPLDATVEKQRAALGIADVLNMPFDRDAVVKWIKEAIEKAEAAKRESALRKQKQIQIQQRLRTASNKYAAMSEQAARERLNQPPPPVQDFASDDAAPPAPKDPAKPPDEPTWDGDRKSRS